MIKSVIAGAVAMAVVSFGVNAALTTPQGQGRVTFNGTVQRCSSRHNGLYRWILQRTKTARI